MKPLTPTMQELREYMREHTLYRHPGLFWTRDPDFVGYGTTYGSSSVQALVSRGIAEYVEWVDGKSGRFPVQARLVKA